MNNVVFLSFGAVAAKSTTRSQAQHVSNIIHLNAGKTQAADSEVSAATAPTFVDLLDVDSCQTANTQYIIEQQIKKLTSASGVDRLDVYATFEELSLDFIVLFGLKKTLSSIFKVSLSDVEFSLFSCIATLADHVVDQVNQKLDTVVQCYSEANHRSVTAGLGENTLNSAGLPLCKRDNVVSISLGRSTTQGQS
ncbi:hypothetical protein TDB9533_04187 [Thalassocella blandensis]|nr:hypothetical protein TDB9533_04187 [Thalassocella blandensis]